MVFDNLWGTYYRDFVSSLWGVLWIGSYSIGFRINCNREWENLKRNQLHVNSWFWKMCSPNFVAWFSQEVPDRSLLVLGTTTHIFNGKDSLSINRIVLLQVRWEVFQVLMLINCHEGVPFLLVTPVPSCVILVPSESSAVLPTKCSTINRATQQHYQTNHSDHTGQDAGTQQ